MATKNKSVGIHELTVEDLRHKWTEEDLVIANRPINVETYRDRIESLHRAMVTVRSIHADDNLAAEIAHVQRRARELMDSFCPRAKPRDRERAERAIDQATVLVLSKKDP